MVEQRSADEVIPANPVVIGIEGVVKAHVNRHREIGCGIELVLNAFAEREIEFVILGKAVICADGPRGIQDWSARSKDKVVLKLVLAAGNWRGNGVEDGLRHGRNWNRLKHNASNRRGGGRGAAQLPAHPLCPGTIEQPAFV